MLSYIKKGLFEEKAPFFSFLTFFFIISSYYILKPLRNSLILKFKITTLPYISLMMLSVSFISTYLYSYLVKKYSRRNFIFISFAFFIILPLIFLFLFSQKMENKILIILFYLYVNVFSIFMVAVFWSFTNDFYTSLSAKRYYAFIGAGGLLGSTFGSYITFSLVKRIKLIYLLPISSILLLIAYIFHLFLERKRDKNIKYSKNKNDRKESNIEKTGMKLILTTPYLLLLATFVFLFTSAGMFFSFANSAIVKITFVTSEQRVAYFAQIFKYLSIYSFIVQLLVAPVFLKFNFKIGFLLTPIFQLLLLSILFYEPLIIWAAAYQIFVSGTSYSLGRVTGEFFYLPLDFDSKYKAKHTIETFFFRAGSAFASIVVILFQLQRVRSFLLTGLFLSILNIVFIYLLFKKYEQKYGKKRG